MGKNQEDNMARSHCFHLQVSESHRTGNSRGGFQVSPLLVTLKAGIVE